MNKKLSSNNQQPEEKADSFQEKPKVVQREERILKYWEDNQTFKKSVEKDAPNGNFIFYDGPPFATGEPHYGNLIPGTMKDVIPRYKTMQGYKVVRRWGWDTHGVPIEAIVQEENKLDTKQDVEKFGIKEFTDYAKTTIFRYADNWEQIIPRTGRWVDFKDLYITMSSDYIESVWWMWKSLYEKGLVYEGFKSMHVSPPLETALSNFEVNQGYKDVTDISVTCKFELLDEPGTFVLAWTTTPWTLPGNVALAVNKNISYVKIAVSSQQSAISSQQSAVSSQQSAISDLKESYFILAKNRLEDVFKNKEYKLIEDVSAKDLIGKSYKPLFDYYSKDEELENKENGWKIYHGDFVTTEDGTGVVHIAPAFGEDDLIFGQEYNLPFVQHVKINGAIKDEVADFAGLQVKPKEDPTATDVKFIKYLAEKELLFAKEKYTHSYPHCYRTDAPLINYAMSSWFIKVTDIREKLVEENEKINWIPDFVGKARFGNWLKEAKDWAVSRSRYWGTPIPVWKSEDGKEVVVLGSLEDLREKTKTAGNIFLMRHGEAEHNVAQVVNEDDSKPSHVTEKGRQEIEQTVKELKEEKIDLIFVSPLLRTRTTALLVAEGLGIEKEKIIIDERISETKTGISSDNKEEYRKLFKSHREKFDKAHPGGETLTEMKHRVGNFLYEINEKYKGKNILVVSHEYPIWMMSAIEKGFNKDQSSDMKDGTKDFIHTGEFIKLDFAPIPHNEDYELDFHRPYIDEIKFEQNGKEMKRIPEVFDAWIDSGCVPFASNHYPFNKERFNPEENKNYPADFIAEGLDQTRGWFYSLIVLNTALFGSSPYKNVIVNGLMLAEDGRKMSKHLKNFKPVNYILDKYGADAFRYFILASPVVRAEESLFSEKGIDEVMKKLIGRLDNVVTFYEMYCSQQSAVSSQQSANSNQRLAVSSQKSENVLDKWILARLNEVGGEVTKSLEAYELDRAARPLLGFVDDLSTWYVRRSRDRFKENNQDKEFALITTKYVLENFAKLLAPFTPFVAEDVYQRVQQSAISSQQLAISSQQSGDSVHLTDWPRFESPDQKILDEMKNLRNLVTQTLEIRTSAGIKVRQPLAKLTLKNEFLKDKKDLQEILKDEINVKEIEFNKDQEEALILDQNITEELKAEGDARELIRAIQNLRKQADLSPENEIVLSLSDSLKDLVNKFEEEIAKTAKVKEFKFGLKEGEVVNISEVKNFIKIN